MALGSSVSSGRYSGRLGQSMLRPELQGAVRLRRVVAVLRSVCHETRIVVGHEI
jgi:hypothetical protein